MEGVLYDGCCKRREGRQPLYRNERSRGLSSRQQTFLGKQRMPGTVRGESNSEIHSGTALCVCGTWGKILFQVLDMGDTQLV